MDSENIVEILSLILTIIVALIAVWKILSLSASKIKKAVLIAVLSPVGFIVWYLMHWPVSYILATTIPHHSIVNCFYLNEKNCKARPDCELSRPITLGPVEPSCQYK